MKNIVLIGMPGSGKSTLGVLLAKALGMGFLDTDLVLQKRAGCLLQTLVEVEGKDGFLDREREAILSLENLENTVVATGGSAVLRAESMKHLKKNGVCVYLSLSYAAVFRRIRNIKTRGIAFGKGETLRDLYRERLPYYKRYADLTLPCGRLSVEKNVEKLLQLLKNEGILSE